MTELRTPTNLSDFQRRIDRYRREKNISPDRLHQRISAELLFAVLSAATQRNIIPLFVLKGGMAMELRFGIRARASGDVDVGIVVPTQELLTVFDRALSVGFANFEFRRKGDPLVFARANTLRLAVQISLRGRAFSLLNVDLNEASIEDSVDFVSTEIINELGLSGPLAVATLETTIQIAQKLHAATEPSTADYKNNRYRDLIDILVFAQNDPSLNYAALRSAVVNEFARRRTHKRWPPLFTMPAHWREPLQREAESLGIEPTDPDLLAAEFTRVLAAVEGVPVKDYYEYRFVSLQMNISGNDLLPVESHNEVRRLESEGWRVIQSSFRPGYQDQLLFILQRGGPLPRFQLRMESRTMPGQPVALVGDIRNVSDQPANKVRVFMTGVEGVVRVGNLTSSDGPVGLQIPYDSDAARTQQIQFPGVFVQYLTDDDRKVQQASVLLSHRDTSGRYSYTLRGLDAPQLIPRFTMRHDPWDEI